MDTRRPSLQARRRHEKLARARLCLLFSPSLCRIDPWKTLRAALAGGADMIQIREKEANSRELLALTRRVQRVVGSRALVIVNDRIDVALLAKVDGVHLGQEDLTAAIARKLLGPDLLLGISTHDTRQAKKAWKDGADYLGFGPIFPTKTKGYTHGLGAGAAVAMEKHRRGPIFLIGGIRADRIASLPPSMGLAVSSAILGAKNPRRSSENLLAGR